MKEREEKLDHATLTRMLDYDPDSGVFRWRECGAKWKNPGDVAGCFSRGYWIIGINRTRYFAHRLAWFYVNGRWPVHELDHINLDRSDNRITNLREATHSLNMRNVKIRKHNSTGFKGVILLRPTELNRMKRDRYVARIIVDGKMIYLGNFDTPEQAHAAYAEASLKYHGKFGRKS